MRSHAASVLVLASLLLAGCRAPLRLAYGPDQVRTVSGRGLVVAEDPTAAAVGAAVLREGGNAVDAAVATAFAMAVTYPQAANPGGGGFAVVSLPDGRPFALDFRETAPAAATRDMFLDAKGKVDRRLSLRSGRAAGVPGTVAGLDALHRRAGRLPWARLVEPAVRLAAEGFPIPAGLADALEEHRKRFLEDPAARAVFVREDRRWRAGDLLVQSDLARTLAAVRDGGAAAFTDGPVAQAIARAATQAEGVLTARDLHDYAVAERTPASFPFRSHEVLTMPLPSSGGVTLRQILGILDAAGGASTRAGTAERLHLLAEAERRAFADRNARLGDPAGVPADLVAALTDEAYLRRRAASIDPGRATPSFEIGEGETAPHDTTHLSVVDAEGGAVALTFSLNSTFGTHLVAPGTGVLLNDTMDDFAARPGEPNLYGLRQGEANAIRPGRRPLSSMSPTIVRTSDGQVVLVLGAAGGPRILSAVAEVVIGHVGDGLPVDVAAIAPRIHHQHRPDVLEVERAIVTWPPGGDPGLEITPEKVGALERMGHFVEERRDGIGRLTAISRDPETGDLRGVAGPRTYGAAAAE